MTLIRAALATLVLALPINAHALQPLDAFRQQHGLGPLSPSAMLERVAMGHARYLSRLGRLTHTGPQGTQIGDRARRGGYRYCYIGENLALGHTSLPWVMRDWARSPGHRRVLLSEHATEYGLVRMPGDVWVLVLGRPGC